MWTVYGQALDIRKPELNLIFSEKGNIEHQRLYVLVLGLQLCAVRYEGCGRGLDTTRGEAKCCEQDCTPVPYNA